MLCRRYITRTGYCESQTLIQISRLCVGSKSNFCVNTSKEVNTSQDEQQKQTKQPVRKKPRRVTVFTLFMKHFYTKIKEETPGTGKDSFIKNARTGRELWASSTEEFKQEIKDLREVKHQEWKEDLKDYYANLTPEIILKDAKVKATKRDMKIKKDQILLGMPKTKKYTTSFNLFMSERLKKAEGEGKIEWSTQMQREKYRDMLDQWATLSTEEREGFDADKIEKNKDYETDMIKWEREMIALGRCDLIRWTTFNKLRNREFGDIFTELEIQTMQTRMAKVEESRAKVKESRDGKEEDKNGSGMTVSKHLAEKEISS